MRASRLSFARAGQRTAVTGALAVQPLRLLTPRNHGDAAWAYTTTLGGGLLGGDAVRLDVHVGQGARAVVSSQGATRIYRSARDARSELHAEVGEAGLLALLPDPTACFAGSSLEQHTRVELAEGASFVSMDVLAAGRDRWAMRRYRSSLAVLRGGRALIADALLLDPAHGPLAERLSGFECLATVALVGPLVQAHAAALLAAIDAAPQPRRAALVEAASAAGTPAASPSASPAAPFAPAGTLSASPGASGVVLRLAGRSVEDVVARVRSRLAFLAPLLGDDVFARRW